MIVLDHLILRVADAATSVRFYGQLLGFAHEGRVGPFDVLRVSDTLTLDLLPQPPQDPTHLAFALDRATFDAVHRRLVESQIPHGNGPFNRDGGAPAPTSGARGLADALYFHDPDRHNIEIRIYPPAAD